ncbi:4Fe-4S single cluster domain-containing protein [Clostridium peptidivorans]|uniref:4Fe-4S single cluster domain-containing protein n=1 Tax=Clostridium peptidivorans TaxID=100174 RepID=UPI000BE420D2|nr:4Fe-4S single cluster domain-containing protein [Clostridium peptidivorans]
MKLKVHRYLKRTEVEGPGIRFCIWVQGCSIKCSNCANIDMWDFNKGIDIHTKELISLIKKEMANIKGVTFLGGEPFDQSNAVHEVAKECRELGLDVIVFTGYTYEEILCSKNLDKIRLLEEIDILIDGPYKNELFDLSRPWVGSSNQRYIFLTEKLKDINLKAYKNKLEVTINSKGIIEVNGMGDFSKIKGLLQSFRR